MAIRNCRDIGENMQKIIRRLMANDDLCKLLYYTDSDPLSHPNLTDEQKEKFLFNKLLKIVPRLDPIEYSNAVVSVVARKSAGIAENTEFKTVVFTVEVFVPITQWLIKGTNLRPYAILGEIQESLDNKTINGLGKMKGGDFDFNFGSDEMTDFEQTFVLVSYA